MKQYIYALLTGAIIAIVSYAVIAQYKTVNESYVNSLQRLASPGPLSAAHAYLENDCSACHTPIEGAEASKCILCHSAETSLLQRQPTAFHADIKSCQECHIEHQGRAQLPKKMNHDALAKIGLEELEYSEARNESVVQVSRIINWMNHDPQIKAFLKNQHITSREAVLDCMSCHKNDDRHFELFGNDCMQCHGTASWKIARFVHPSPSSRECAQCHQAPPSHYMGHFNMISRPVSGKMQARIDQCYLCHQTTSWPDIKDIGWYKHH
jgi:hypothetical protein